jgi:DtxR family transcriptional regulator, Mn-dependent transcriptional regulator
MNIYESAEDYLERILIITKEKGSVISLDIANSMGFSKASVSTAMKNLRENGYISIGPNKEIFLEEKGYLIASRIYERHTILTNLFVSLGVDPTTARIDACKVEHDLSEETFQALKNYYNNIKK